MLPPHLSAGETTVTKFCLHLADSTQSNISYGMVRSILLNVKLQFCKGNYITRKKYSIFPP